MKKPFRTGMVVGRFQMPHIMHKRIIDSVIATCDLTLVLLGSSQEHGTERNPFSWEFRAWMIDKFIPKDHKVLIAPLPDMTHENDISHDWGRYVLEYAEDYLLDKPEVMAYGNDENRHGWFDEKDIEHMTEIIIPRIDDGISATKMREHLRIGNFWEWRKYVPQELHPHFHIIRGEYAKEIR